VDCAFVQTDRAIFSPGLLSHRPAEFLLQLLQPTVAPVSVHFRPQCFQGATLPRVGPDTPGGFGLDQKVYHHPHQVMRIQLEVDESIQVGIGDFPQLHGVLPCSSARRRQTHGGLPVALSPAVYIRAPTRISLNLRRSTLHSPR